MYKSKNTKLGMGTSETLQRQQILVVTRCTFLQDNSGED